MSHNILHDYTTDPIKCLGCAAELDGALATNPDAQPPQDGDLSICIYCSSMSIYDHFNGHIVLREPTDEEFKEFMADAHVAKCIAAIRATREAL